MSQNFLNKSKAHPGFKEVANKISAKKGISQERASAILAASTRRAGKSARKANPRLNRVKKSLSLGDLFETAAMLPRMLSGAHDWNAPRKNSFVMIRINNRKSDLDGRHVILERTENGTYRIAKRPDSHNEKRDHGDTKHHSHNDRRDHGDTKHRMEKLEKDDDSIEDEEIEKGFGLRTKRRTPSRASSRRFTSLSMTKSLEKLKNAIKNHCAEE